MSAPGSADTDGRLSREPVRYLVFSASLRADSLDTRLARLAAETIGANGDEVDYASMREFDVHDADLQKESGFPPERSCSGTGSSAATPS